MSIIKRTLLIFLSLMILVACGGSNTNNITLVVTPDTQTVVQNSSTQSIPVLENDHGNGLVIKPDSVTTPNQGGTAVINGVNIDYTPAVNFHGVETFNYTVVDGEKEATTTVTVTVTEIVNSNPSSNKAPVLYFSDLIDGNVTGWNGGTEKGVAVSIWGNNIESTRGNSYVSVGSVKLRGDSDYAEWGADTNPINARGLERITFWLKPNMVLGDTHITVTTDNGSSNAIPFHTRNTGNIYFISPNGTGSGHTITDSMAPHDYYLKTQSEVGSTGYFLAGTYNQEYGHPLWHTIFLLRSDNSGAPNNHNAFVAYPGDDVLFQT